MGNQALDRNTRPALTFLSGARFGPVKSLASDRVGNGFSA
jgi:hypothetical protein